MRGFAIHVTEGRALRTLATSVQHGKLAGQQDPYGIRYPFV